MIHLPRPALVSALLLALLLGGCKSSSTSSSGATGTSAASLPASFTTATVSDPSFNNMQAETMTIPAGWKMDGTIMTAPCTTLPWPVYRAYSSDGLTEIRQYPALGWHWNAHGSFNQGGCLTLQAPMSASDFLNHFLTTLGGGVNIVGAMPVTPTFSQWAQHFADVVNQSAAQNTFAAAQSHTTADTASLHIQTHNGSFVIDQRLRAVVICTIYPNPGYLQGGACWGRVDNLRAPQNQLDALDTYVDNNNLPKPVDNPQWDQAVLARNKQQMQQAANTLFNMQAQAAATFRAMNQQFMQTMQQNFQNFQASQQAKFNNFEAGQAANQAARDQMTSDWVDFALDQQTVASPTGSTMKVSNAYSQTWSNGSQWFQTNDPNVNPNGTLTGTWTQQTQVHGNGTPM